MLTVIDCDWERADIQAAATPVMLGMLPALSKTSPINSTELLRRSLHAPRDSLFKNVTDAETQALVDARRTFQELPGRKNFCCMELNVTVLDRSTWSKSLLCQVQGSLGPAAGGPDTALQRNQRLVRDWTSAWLLQQKTTAAAATAPSTATATATATATTPPS